MNRPNRLIVIVVVCLVAAPASLSWSAAQPPLDPKSASLATAVADWITLLEKSDLKTATARWAADDNAAKSLAQEWDSLQKLHKEHDYRRWLKKSDNTPNPAPTADQITDATHFKVGGHAYGHRHIEWIKTNTGWRIANVWLCR